ncbi:hypothetical protein Clacol_008393 [Clathrus columnatus]|uniref:T6SS Phospholipase effector Tle1-like catalytic domain-containing protein n=1 Tax=Clathrus columnatus TaxID=1419009 RepID=A0AAV5AMR3_9AGAM|nr:hypothetical protein Clacol_008393 [Clathrus columnatus]
MSTPSSTPTTASFPRCSAFKFGESPPPSASKTPDEYHDMDHIPSMHSNRTLVLCFDGTGDSFDADNSNVVHFFSMLKKDDFREQMVYYQAGIGTYTVPEIATPGMAKLSKTLDMMIAWNLDAHVMGLWIYISHAELYAELSRLFDVTLSLLLDTYGDKICLFGFSRGAYTARALAGMLHKVGLLPADNHQQLPFAYKMYTRADETFRHAIALDERRAKFKANLFNRPDHDESLLGTQPGEMPKAGVGMKTSSQKRHPSKQHHDKMGVREKEFTLQERTRQQTDVLEVWFAGCHTDVGGGSVANDSRHNLARIPLRWMIRQCFLTNSGVRFHSELLKTIGLDPTSLYPEVKPRPPALVSPSSLCRSATPESNDNKVGYANIARTELMTEEGEDLADALCPIYDQLRDRRAWWILEAFPIKERIQQGDNTWKKEINFGKGREIPIVQGQPLYFHRTVKTRMESLSQIKGKKNYKPKAKYHIEPVFVD